MREEKNAVAFATRILHALTLCIALVAAAEAAAAPLRVVGRFLQDAHGNNVLMRGVNLPVYKSGYADDLDAVAAAIALTKTNAVRLEWWAVPLAGQTEYSVANFDRAIQKFYDLGIIPVVELHDLTFQYGHDAKSGLNSDGNDPAVFASTITAFWTRADVLAVLVKHQDHLVINLANEWGSSFYSDATPTTANFIQNYTAAITAMRNAGIIAPLMVDAPKGFEYQFLLDHGPALLAADPQNNTILSTHAYWAATDPAFTDAGVNAILDAFAQSGLPVVLGEASSNAYTNIPCDPIHYQNLLTRANSNGIGYLFWAWYEDGQCGQLMNITVGADGVTRPTIANPGFGYDSLFHPGFGIETAQPPTIKADFTPVSAPALLNTGFDYSVTSTDDGVTRAAAALVTRLDNFGAEKRPVVVLMPGWGGVGDVAAARDAQATMFANQGYVALNIGFHQTNSGAWYSDLPESAKAALDALCVQTYVDCSAVVLVGESYGGTQMHPVVRYLRALGVFDGSGAANAGRKVVALLGQDSGYTYYFAAPIDADATAYSIGMIQNLGDTTFPVDSCADGNCGARNRADYHQAAAGSQFVLSYCPAGGEHGTRGYADWDAWVLSAVKVMLHNQRGVPKFTGYVEPALAVSNACLSAPSPPPRLINISTRGQVQTGFDVMIGGFVISGSSPKTVVIRAIGPSLANYGVAGSLSNPQLQLVRSSDQTTIAANDDWGTAANAADITSSGFAPANALESAILATLQPGAYTAIVSGVGGATGVGLIETYEVDHPDVPLINISTRGKVQTGFDVMIGGFVIQGSGPQTIVVRAIGPSLANYGVAGALANPQIQLVRSSDQTIIATNDDWGSHPNAAQVQTNGFAPANPLEAAIYITLDPGAYTAIVSGVGGGTGVGLVEVYKAGP